MLTILWLAVALALTTLQPYSIASGTPAASQPMLASKVRSTNRLTYPYFDQNRWQSEAGPSDVVSERFADLAVGWEQAGFAYRVLRMNAVSSAVQAGHPADIPIDPSKSYRVGVWGVDDAGGGINVLVTALDVNGGSTATFSVPLTLTTKATEVAATINAHGGAAPGWPANTVAARIRLQNADTGTDKYVFAAYAIPAQELPNTTFTKAYPGGGTHEAAWDGASLFVISHTYNQLAKFDANLERTAITTTDGYPHDVIVLGDEVWVVNIHGKSLQRFSRSSLSLLDSYPIHGNRSGFGVVSDGIDLFLGVGLVPGGETPAIVKFDVSTQVQTQLTTDVYGGSANVPVQYLAGSLWSIHQTNSQVKRIDPTGGATVATVNCDIGDIYGLGHDGTLIYAAGTRSVAVIDPAANAVVGTYKFTRMWGMGSNLRLDAHGRMWGAGNNGVFVIDHANRRFLELPHVLGGPKWVHPIPSGMAVGYYMMPSIDVFR
jgi:hypothetical protein